MPFTRRIAHHPGSAAAPGEPIDDRAIVGCRFEWLRQGGCGSGELTLDLPFDARDSIQPGDWVSCADGTGARWYLGRVEERRTIFPQRMTLLLEGMAVELNELYPGGFARESGVLPRPHRFGRTDLFPTDPDHAAETFDHAASPEEVVQLLLDRYAAATPLTIDPARVEASARPAEVVSLKFQGEESLRSILKDLALRAAGASWGVDEAGAFFFLRPRTTRAVTLRLGDEVVELGETASRQSLYNRVLLTGGYVYRGQSGGSTVLYRWRGNYRQPESVAAHGERRIRLWIPWIRTPGDARAFLAEFFNTYARLRPRYRVTAVVESRPERPWEATYRLLDADGHELMTAQPESVRIDFDRVPKLAVELGPPDPHTLWPEPPHDERWPVAPPGAADYGTDDVSLPSDLLPTDGGSSGGGPPPGSSDESNLTSSLLDPSGLDSSELLSSDLDSSDLYSSDGWSWGDSTASDSTGDDTTIGSDTSEASDSSGQSPTDPDTSDLSGDGSSAAGSDASLSDGAGSSAPDSSTPSGDNGEQSATISGSGGGGSGPGTDTPSGPLTSDYVASSGGNGSAGYSDPFSTDDVANSSPGGWSWSDDSGSWDGSNDYSYT